MGLTRRIRRPGLIAVFIGLLLLTVGTCFPVWERFKDKAVTVQPDSHVAVATEMKEGVYRHSFSSSSPVEFWTVNRENFAYLVLENHSSVSVDGTLTLSWASQYTVAMTSFLRVIEVANATVGIASIVFRRKAHE